MLSTALFSLRREGWEEIRLHGEMVADDGDRIAFQTDESPGRYPARSLLKPFQFVAAGLPEAIWRREEPGNPYVAAVGSVSATAEQVRWLERSLGSAGRAGLAEHLRVPPSYPMDEGHRVRLREAGKGPERIFHTCFSKHLAILEACRRNDWPLDSYLEVSHPYHARLLATLEGVLGRIGDVTTVPDGCSLPSPVLSLGQMARLYQRLASAEASSALAGARDLMLADPRTVGGPRRLDTRIMEQNPGRCVAKEGADGLLGIGILPGPRFPRGMGIVLKTAPGYQPALAALAIAPVLRAFGLAMEAEVPKGQAIEYAFPLPVAPVSK